MDYNPCRWDNPLHTRAIFRYKTLQTNKRFEMGGASRSSQVTPGYVDEQFLKKNEQVIVKRRVAGQYSPDKLEKWLEAMEAKGYNLIRISKFGIKYYFVKGSPKKVSFQNLD
ncbi:DUF2812 domain-containing protein [Lentibacillus sediminis]|uniref:DUF2812 domain-containing protein n=1 Tax=Lentibacillus sediminis TaxID=1940529 RepID=UPI00195BECB5|nr:DUF2812 domain-containing protein [Lentibacillus sediminis]